MKKTHSDFEIERGLDERLLTAALEVFLDKGFAAASIDEIAAQAKASKITFYKHYGNKEALFEAVVLRQNAALEEVVWSAIPAGLPIEELLETVATRLYSVLLKKDTVKLLRVLHAEAVRFPKLGAIFDDAGPAKSTKMLAAELEKYMEVGILRRADPRLAAEQFFHLSIGELSRRILLGLRPPLTKAETTLRIRAAIDVFKRAYGGQPLSDR